MGDLLKEVYTKPYLIKVAQEVKSHYIKFDSKKFLSLVFSRDWAELELKMRMKKISSSLHVLLPEDYSLTIEILLKSSTKFSGFEALFFPDYVETYGKDKSNRSLSLIALEELTKYSSSEFAIRPFIEMDTIRTMKKMLTWSKSKNYHVRRLSSEGCRPRLPWGISLKEFKKDPKLIIPILENLKNDDELYVRKSVANNLNDISKDHPTLVIKLAKKWYGKNSGTDWIVKHGLRTLLKSGNPEALKIIGYNNEKYIQLIGLSSLKSKVKIGDRLDFSFSLNVLRPSQLRIEYRIYYLKKNGNHNPKIFKIVEGSYEKGIFDFRKNQSFREMTTRKHYKGEHYISIIINGVEKSKLRFEVI